MVELLYLEWYWFLTIFNNISNETKTLYCMQMERSDVPEIQDFRNIDEGQNGGK